MEIPSYSPQCPNHRVDLIDLPFPLPKKGTGVCPISKCKFDYEIDLEETEEKTVKDKFGNLIRLKDWKVTGDEE